MEYHALAALARTAAAEPPATPAARARLAARAAALGVPAESLADLLRLWTPQGWTAPAALQEDAATLCYWDGHPDQIRL